MRSPAQPFACVRETTRPHVRASVGAGGGCGRAAGRPGAPSPRLMHCSSHYIYVDWQLHVDRSGSPKITLSAHFSHPSRQKAASGLPHLEVGC